jgi:hypothetical protein
VRDLLLPAEFSSPDAPAPVPEAVKNLTLTGVVERALLCGVAETWEANLRLPRVTKRRLLADRFLRSACDRHGVKREVVCLGMMLRTPQLKQAAVTERQVRRTVHADAHRGTVNPLV